jgi:hypothetical protein
MKNMTARQIRREAWRKDYEDMVYHDSVIQYFAGCDTCNRKVLTCEECINDFMEETVVEIAQTDNAATSQRLKIRMAAFLDRLQLGYREKLRNMVNHVRFDPAFAESLIAEIIEKTKSLGHRCSP